MIAPTWRHLRLGPYLRGERDKRQYQRLFRFPMYITGLKRLYLLKQLPQVNAEECNVWEADRKKLSGIVVFNNAMSKNEETFFHEIIAHHQLVHDALRHITKRQYLPAKIDYRHIALHVRMGDFDAAQSENDLRAGIKNTRIPLAWYSGMLAGLRSRLKRDLPAVVYSDGDDQSLAPLLNGTAVARAPKQSAVTDLLSIAQATVLISSGSGFSQWGSYLGQVPRICFPGQRFCRVLASRPGFEFEPECETSDQIDAMTIDYLHTRVEV